MIILALFLGLLINWRTLFYKWLVDDHITRDRYLWDVCSREPKGFLETKKGWREGIFSLVTFAGAILYINQIWGWKAALLFSVFPLNVIGVAWVTGSFYMGTCVLCLAAWYWTKASLVVGAIFYWAALHSTVNALGVYPVLLLSGNWLATVPLIQFLTSKRLRTGLEKRTKGQVNINQSFGFKKEHLKDVIPVVGYYVFLSLWPSRLGFYHGLATKKKDWIGKGGYKFYLASGALIILGLMSVFVDNDSWNMALWWFGCIGIFSQFIVFGQYVAERYTVVANVAFCVVLAKMITAIPDTQVGLIILSVLTTLYFIRSWDYVKAFKDVESLFAYSICNHPTAPENYINLATYYIEKNNYNAAIKPLLVAMKYVEVPSYGIMIDLAMCYANCGAIFEAHRWAGEAEKIAPLDTKEKVQDMRLKLQNKLIDIQRKEKELRKIGL